MKHKTKRIIRAIVIAVLLLLLLTPRVVTANDGGSVIYAAVLYQVTDYHKLARRDGVYGHTEGVRVDILGIKVFEKTEFVPNKSSYG